MGLGMYREKQIARADGDAEASGADAVAGHPGTAARVSTSDKLLAVFGLFTLDEPEWTVDAAAERLALASSTAYRFFKSLSDVGLISAFATGRYVLGPAIVQLDRQTRLLDPLIKVAQPIMQAVVAEIRVPGVLLLCRLFRNQVMCIHQEFLDRPSSVISYERGRPMALYRGAASKAILAHLPARFVRGFHEAHRAEMSAAGFAPDWEGVKATLRRLRSNRVCVTAGELDAGMTGIAAPLHNAEGAVDASLGFVMPDSDEGSGQVARVSAALSSAATEIDAKLALAAKPSRTVAS
jgi:DNA-binding IclR family transcriptional regulator